MPNLPYKSNAATWDTHSPVGQVRYDFPFAYDFSVYTVTRSYIGPLSTYAAPVLGTADATYTAHRLVAQSPLEPGDAGTVRYTRTWSPIPADQLTYAARLFPRPRLHDIVVSGGLSSIWCASFDDNTSTLFFSRLTSGVSLGAVGTSYLNENNSRATFGHYLVTVTLNTGTQSFFLDDSDSAIKNALSIAFTGSTANAANFYLSRWQFGLYISWAGVSVITQAVSSSANEVEVSPRTVSLGMATSNGPIEFVAASTQRVSIRTVNATAHGGVVGDRVALWNGSRLVSTSRVVAAATDSFTIPAEELPGNSEVITAVQFAKNGLRLVHGAKDCSIRTTEKFYLPGVTAGITTGADVPSVPLYTDPIAWLGRIAATTHSAVTATALTDLLTKTAHGLATGDIFFVLAQTGAAGLSTLTPYYAIRSDANNFKAAVSHAAAVSGTAIDITSDGTALTLLVPAPYAAIAVSDLRAWMGPILAKSYDEVQLLDAIEVRSATA